MPFWLYFSFIALLISSVLECYADPDHSDVVLPKKTIKLDTARWQTGASEEPVEVINEGANAIEILFQPAEVMRFDCGAVAAFSQLGTLFFDSSHSDCDFQVP